MDDPKNKIKKKVRKKERSLKKPKHVTSHVFAETTHIVAVLPNFAWCHLLVSILTWLYILSFIKIISAVAEPWKVEKLPSELVWLVAFITA